MFQANVCCVIDVFEHPFCQIGSAGDNDRLSDLHSHSVTITGAVGIESPERFDMPTLAETPRT